MGFEDSTDKCAGQYSYLCNLIHLSAQLHTVFDLILWGELAGIVGWKGLMYVVIM
jgi:hypothetical protein